MSSVEESNRELKLEESLNEEKYDNDFQDVYTNYEKQMKADGIDPEDIIAVIDILKKAQKK